MARISDFLMRWWCLLY